MYPNTRARATAINAAAIQIPQADRDDAAAERARKKAERERKKAERERELAPAPAAAPAAAAADAGEEDADADADEDEDEEEERSAAPGQTLGEVDAALITIKNSIKKSQVPSYYNSLDGIISSIVNLMTEWPKLTQMAGSAADVRLYVSSKISTLFLDIIQDWLGSDRKYVRSTLLLGEDTDAECNKARENARAIALADRLADRLADPSPVLGYTVSRERETGSTGRGNPPIAMETVTWNKNEYVGVANYVPSGTPTITEFVKASKNSWEEDANNTLGKTVQRGNCGNCWLCSEPVYFYKSGKGFTGCGQCEHMGAIIGTIISYMTATNRYNKNSAYGYATSHTWCNQVKTDILPMRFGEGGWVKDDYGIGEIAKRIMGIGITSEWNYQEYDPLQWKRIHDWRQLHRLNRGEVAYTKIVNSITAGTILWCKKANENLESVILSPSETGYEASGPGPEDPKDIIQNLTRIITYVLEDTTGRAIDANVGVWGAKKKGGSIGNIYPESVSSSEKITDKNIYKDINKKIDEKIDEKSDEKSNIIDLNNIYNRALGVTIKNKEDLIKVIYDVLTKLYESVTIKS